MSTVCVFPWVGLPELLEVGGFQLLPFERHRWPAGPVTSMQRLFDAVLAPYKEQRGTPIEHATLVRHPHHGVTDDLSGEERGDLFTFAELLAFCGLASRQFFGFGLNYVNRDDYTFVIQSFVDPGAGVSITTRRRDGVMNNYYTAGLYEFRRPLHRSPNATIRIDVSLMQAVLNAQRGPEWERLWDAILAFNRANTDSEQIMEEAEVVFIVGALQRLLDCRTSNVDDLANRFTEAFAPRFTIPLPGVLRAGCLTTERSVREVWMRSLYAVRGPLAHARRSSRVPSPWSLREHLLLSSYAFPLLVKLTLERARQYALTDADKFDVDVFEALAATPDLLADPAQSPDGRPAWERVRVDAIWRWRSQRRPHPG